MAAPVVNINTSGAFGLTNITTADSTTNWNGFKISGGGATPTAVLEQDIFIEGTAAVSAKISGTAQDKGLWYDNGSGIDMTVAGRHLYVWCAYTTPGSLNTIANNGLLIYISTAGGGAPTEYSAFAVGGSDTIVDGGFIRFVIDCNKTPSRSAGSTTLTSVQHFGIGVNHTGTVKSENLVIDRIDYGDGLQIEEGDSTTPCTWAELFAVDDTNKYGIIQERSGVYFLKGGLTIGDPAGTVSTLWDDQSGATVVFEDPKYYNGSALVSAIDAANLYKIEVVGNATGTTDVDFGSVVGTGDDRQGLSGGAIQSAGPKWQFDAETDIADVDTVNLYGVQWQGAGITQFSGLTKTDIIGCTFTECDEIQPNDAEFLNNTIIAPKPDRGLEMTASQAMKNLTFVAGGTADRPVDWCWQVDAAPVGYVDYTAEANDTTANNVLPYPASEGPGDYPLFGSRQKFAKLRVNTGTAGAGGTPAVTWEYWNGSTWAALASVTDGTSAFTVTGLQDVTYTVPTDWAATSVNDEDPVFYIRARVTSTYGTTNPLITQVFIADPIEHHLHSPAAITEDVDNFQFFGFGAAGAPKWMGENSSAGTTTWTVINTGDLVAGEVQNTGGGSTTVNNEVVVKVTVKDLDQNAIEGARVYVQNNAGPFDDNNHIVRESTNASGIAQENYAYSVDLSVRVRVRLRGFLPYDQVQTITDTGLDLAVQLSPDPIVE